jgi:hypothetical protein
MAGLNPWLLDGTAAVRGVDGAVDPRVGPPQFSPNAAQGYHYFHNGETYYLTGLAMARGMVQMMPH